MRFSDRKEEPVIVLGASENAAKITPNDKCKVFRLPFLRKQLSCFSKTRSSVFDDSRTVRDDRFAFRCCTDADGVFLVNDRSSLVDNADSSTTHPGTCRVYARRTHVFRNLTIV